MKINHTLLFALLLLSATSVFANNYTITFPNFAYIPDSLNVNVGDVITWTGSFSFHPLESTSIPAGAVAFSSSTGTTYAYTITTPGTYRYHCAIHDFKGVLIASDPSAIKEAVSSARLTVYPNPANDQVSIGMDENMLGSNLSITDLTGREVLHSTVQVSNPQIDIRNLSPGVYFVTVENEKGRMTRKLVKE